MFMAARSSLQDGAERSDLEAVRRGRDERFSTAPRREDDDEDDD